MTVSANAVTAAMKANRTAFHNGTRGVVGLTRAGLEGAADLIVKEAIKAERERLAKSIETQCLGYHSLLIKGETCMKCSDAIDIVRNR